MTEYGTALRVLDENAIIIGHHFPVERYDEWKALLAWCEFHGLNPERMPLGQLIVRNLAQCRIEYEEFVLDEPPGPPLDTQLGRATGVSGSGPSPRSSQMRSEPGRADHGSIHHRRCPTCCPIPSSLAAEEPS